MLLQMNEFKFRVINNMDSIIGELKLKTCRSTFAEENAWRTSLTKIVKAFSNSSFDHLHLFFRDFGNLALEYRMPGGNGWADLVLLGKHKGKPSAVVVELKDWQTRGDLPGPGEGLIYRHSRNESHPSSQVGGYVEWCSKFHSVVLDCDANVNGCVIFTKDQYYQSYLLAPNDKLAKQYPCFGLGEDDINTNIPNYFAKNITESDKDFALNFTKGTYRQARSFVSLVGSQILDKTNSPFVLLDGQRTAFSLIRARVLETVKNQTNKKQVIIIKGPPGSGKSAVTAKVWASLVTDKRISDGNIVITTTSTSQNTNWQFLFNKESNNRAACGAIMKATGYTPITTFNLKQLRDKYPDALRDANEWRHNMNVLNSLISEFPSGSRTDEFLVSLVDEAHALINPEHSDGRGQHGFAVIAGPQAYHIMRASQTTVFFLDPEQGFRDFENTTVDDIKKWAEELGVSDVEEISLEDCQFRCAGSKEYVDMIDRTFNINMGYRKENEHSSRQFRLSESQMKITFCQTPHEMEKYLIDLIKIGNSCRLLASYAREWKTKKVANPHKLEGKLMDFNEIIKHNGETLEWNKIWNFAPNSDYTHFIQAPIGSLMRDNPLAEIGCPYVVRNFDFDYIGILWFSDLVWRKDKWIVDLNNVHETGISRQLGRAKKNNDVGAYNDVLNAVKSAYRILLTRAIKGIYIWCEDAETLEFLKLFWLKN